MNCCRCGARGEDATDATAAAGAAAATDADASTGIDPGADAAARGNKGGVVDVAIVDKSATE